VIIVGAPKGHVPPSLSRIVERRPWSEQATARSLAEADVGVMPLPDTPFTRGKCAYKLLQYGAAGLPVVGSPIGASSTVLAAAHAPQPRRLSDWTAALREVLSATDDQRRALGRAVRSVVDQGYTYAAWAEEWRAAVCPS
jgi:glycosyltransferase involved in cell wall biosynthesis